MLALAVRVAAVCRSAVTTEPIALLAVRVRAACWPAVAAWLMLALAVRVAAAARLAAIVCAIVLSTVRVRSWRVRSRTGLRRAPQLMGGGSSSVRVPPSVRSRALPE